MEPSIAILIAVAGLIIVILGGIGSVLPALPGPPLSAASLLLLHFSGLYKFHGWYWVVFAFCILLVIVIAIIDYLIPIYGTKYMGGSKKGITGSTVGLFLGVVLTSWLGPLALVFGPFLGAFVFEYFLEKKSAQNSLKSAFGALIGFLAGTAGKLAAVFIIAVVYLSFAIAGLVKVL